MIHLFRSAVARAVTYGLIGVIVVGLLIGAVRLALPFADVFRSQLEELLTDTLGLEVRVGRLGLRLAGMVPQLTLLDAKLLDQVTHHTQLSLKQLRVEFSLTASVRAMAPKIESVTLVGANLVIKRLADGTIRVAGLEGMEAGDPETMTFFLGNGRFLLTESDVYWIDEKAAKEAPPLHLSDVNTYFENWDERHHIGIRAKLFDDKETHLRLVAGLQGRPRSPQEWSGEIYFRWRDKNLEQVLRGRLPDGLNVGSAAVDIESWNDLEDGALRQSLSRISIRGLTAGNSATVGTAAPLHIDRIEGLLRWRKVENGWRLDLQDLALTRDGKERPASDAGVRYRSDADEAWTVEGGSQLLDLADVRDLLAQVPGVLPRAFDPLQAMHPRGRLRDLQFRFTRRPDLAPSWDFSGRLEDLGLKAHEGIPGVAGLAMEFAGNESNGRLRLNSRDLALDLPRLLPETIRLDELDGVIDWKRGADGTPTISSSQITAGNPDIGTRSRFSLSLPTGSSGPLLDLQTDFRNVELTAVRRYVPTNKLKEKLARWLGTAFEAGRVPTGTLLFRGVPNDFPFDGAQGKFQVLLTVENGTLKYHKDWPPLEEIAGEVQFVNRKMEVFVARARLLDSELISSYATIPDMKRAVAVQVLGRTEGPFADGLRMLGETPLRRKLGAVADTFDADGVARLDLNMAIPLKHKGHKGPLKLTGELTWPGPARIAIPKQNIELSDLGGELHITERSLTAESIAARLWDAPIRLRIDTLMGDKNDPTITRIRADGRLPASSLARRYQFPLWGEINGSSRWEFRLDAPRAASGDRVPPMEFELKTNLNGVTVELPAPLGKGAAEIRPLRFTGRLVPGKTLQSEGSYGDLGFNLGLSRGDDSKLHLTRCTLNLGGGAKPLPKGEGIYVSGAIGSLDLPAWLNWWAGRQPAAGGAGGGTTPLRAADLRVRRLLLTDMAFNDVRFDLDRRGDRWEAGFRARELDGKVTIPHRSRREPIRIDLERLDLKGLLGHEGEEGQSFGDRKQSDPRRAHTLELKVERLLWGESLLGRINLRTQATANGLDLTELALSGPSMSVNGHGSWKQQGGQRQTKLTLNADGTDLGEFLRSLEFSSLFYKAPAELDISLQWPGGPAQFSLADIKGHVGIEVGAGSLLEVDPGVGRMLGILNLETLQRRLTLDFSDLFDRGFGFEKISGELSIQNGKADIKDLEIVGPSADVSIIGQTDLVKQELDQIVTVTPHIGTGVAIASAVAGGPLVGAAVFLADKVSGGAVDKLGRHRYFLSGPWVEPEIRRGTFGADKGQSAEEGLFLTEPGRAGAADPPEPKPQEARANAIAKPKTPAPTRKPGLFGDTGGENLFLEGH